MEKQEPEGLNHAAQMRDDGSFIYYLDTVSALEWTQAYKRRTFALLDLQEGYRVLDVGCGTGEDMCVLAQMVGNQGRVVGVDNSEEILAEARRRTGGLNLSLDYCLCDAHSLNFADNSFDSCRADRTFQHLENPRQALSEMIRVACSGARIAVSEPDWGSLVIDADDYGLTRLMTNLICDNIRNSWMGRQLFGLFKECGLTDITMITDTLILTDYTLANQIFELEKTVEQARQAGMISATDAAQWLSHLETSSRNGRFFSALTGFGVGGRKP